MVGREELLDTLRRQVKKGRHVLLVGAPGIGKSTLVRALVTHAQQQGQRALYVAHASPAKPMLVEIARQLHEQYHALPYAQIPRGKNAAEKAPADLTWEEIYRSINRMQIRELASLLLEVLTQERYLLGLDALEHVTPTQKAILLLLFANVQVIGATAKKGSGQLARLWWSFKVVDVPPLDDAASLALIEQFLTTHPLLIENPHMFRRHAVKAAGGNPQALVDLLANADKERLVKKQFIREEMHHEAGEHYFDLTPIALLGCCVIMASRFLARGMDSADVYLLASTMSALLLFVRLVLARGTART
jgi:energy-coupling factor transporter ATP-binding protein EcfA2